MTKRTDGEIIAAALDNVAAAMLDNARATREWIAANERKFARDQRLADLYAEHTELQLARARDELAKLALTNEVQALIAERLKGDPA